MGSITLNKIAEMLLNAEENRIDIPRITASHELSIEDGYKVQKLLVQNKIESGHRIIGPKMGLTSKAKMKQMNVNEPIYGYIFDYMVVSDNGTISAEELIHPRVEAEIAFVIAEDIKGPGITGAEVLAKTAYVLPALEIIDSRYKNFDFTLPDVVADNASSSRVVFGNKLTKLTNDIQLDLTGIALYINNEMVDCGAGAAVLNHPANSIATLANILSRKNEVIKKGDIVLSGAVTEAHAITTGDIITAKVDKLGSVSFKLTN